VTEVLPIRSDAAVGGLLAIDAGQTGIKLRYRRGDETTEWAAPGIRTDLPLLPQLARAIERAGDAGHRATAVGIGVSGLTAEESDAGALLAAAATLGTRRMLLAHDSITAYLGALGDERGVVVAAGTGVVTLAVGATEVARVDGWGNLIGDAGSGYWLGRAALDAVMRHHDGRGEPTVLTDIVRPDFADLESAYIELQGDPSRVQRIAAYARRVTEVADDDAVAGAIVAEAGRELAASALAGLRRVGEADAAAPRVRGIGGLFHAPALAREFGAELRRLLPAADLRIGEAHPLDGAAALADVGPSSALAAHISHAEH
jgi:N-acetylglucosamine kinase-like BadF-type ATPase